MRQELVCGDSVNDTVEDGLQQLPPELRNESNYDSTCSDTESAGMSFDRSVVYDVSVPDDEEMLFEFSAICSESSAEGMYVRAYREDAESGQLDCAFEGSVCGTSGLDSLAERLPGGDFKVVLSENKTASGAEPTTEYSLSISCLEELECDTPVTSSLSLADEKMPSGQLPMFLGDALENCTALAPESNGDFEKSIVYTVNVTDEDDDLHAMKMRFTLDCGGNDSAGSLYVRVYLDEDDKSCMFSGKAGCAEGGLTYDIDPRREYLVIVSSDDDALFSKEYSIELDCIKEAPSAEPSEEPTILASELPSSTPSTEPSVAPSIGPSSQPSSLPSYGPSTAPTSVPSSSPSCQPTRPPVGPIVIDLCEDAMTRPTRSPASLPSASPSYVPTIYPTINPTMIPKSEPTSPPVPKQPPIDRGTKDTISNQETPFESTGGVTRGPVKCRNDLPQNDIRAVRVDKCAASNHTSPVSIISKDQETVTFTVSQLWKGCGGSDADDFDEKCSVDWLAVDHLTPSGHLECVTTKNVGRGVNVTHTAKCSDNTAVIDLYLKDQPETSSWAVFNQTDRSSVLVPDACGPSSGNSIYSCHFRYLLDCVPRCESDSSARHDAPYLRG